MEESEKSELALIQLLKKSLVDMQNLINYLEITHEEKYKNIGFNKDKKVKE